MEKFPNTSNTSSDFEFKHIPKKEFEKMVTRVQRERMLRGKDGWGSFCSVTSTKDENEDDEKLKEDYVKKRSPVEVLTDDDIQSVIQSIDKSEILRRIPLTSAPFFGPARKLDVEMLRQEQAKRKSLSEKSEESSEASSIHSSIHIVEEVNVAQQTSDAKFQVQNPITVDGASECSSDVDDKESLQSEMLKLCGEIANANGTNSSANESSVDLTHQEEEVLQNIIDKTEEKISCEAYSKFIDKKFDFLYDECKNSDDDDGDDAATQAQTLPVVELRRKKSSKKISPNEDCSNDNNVWIPPVENQIRKSGRQQERRVDKSSVKKKRNDEVFPCDVNIRKVREVGKLKRDVNEKSQDDVTAPSTKKDEIKRGGKLRAEADEHFPSKAEVLSALGRITDYQNKICQFIDYLREIIEDPPELEDIMELKKRQKRATEFSNRFARNHLYQIGRIAEEVRLMPDNPVDVATKVNLLFQVIMHAVQTYLKNVEMFIFNSYPDKLLVLVDFIINAMKICFDRMVFDKRDLVIQQMWRKCSEMKQFLMVNQRSMAKFASILKKHKTSLTSRSSFAYANPYGSKLSMYDAPAVKQKPSTSRMNQPALQSKSPYDAVKPRNLRSSNSSVLAKTKIPPSRSQSLVQSPRVKQSNSNVSTAIQKMKNIDSKEFNLTVSEKPFEDSESQAPLSKEKSKEMEIIQNIAKEKIQEMLAPFLAQLLPQKEFQQSFSESSELQNYSQAPKTTTPRVTSDIACKLINEVKAPLNRKHPDKVERVAENVQYIYVNSNEENSQDLKAVRSTDKLISAKTRVPASSKKSLSEPPAEARAKILSLSMKPPVAIEVEKLNGKLMKELKEKALKERLDYVSQMMQNPLYINEACNEPWKMFAGISDQILDEILKDVIAEFDFGEKTFVEKFIQHELEC